MTTTDTARQQEPEDASSGEQAAHGSLHESFVSTLHVMTALPLVRINAIATLLTGHVERAMHISPAQTTAPGSVRAALDAPQVSPIPADTAEVRRLFLMGLTHLRTSKLYDFPEGTVEVNGQFKRFFDSDTDSAWVGFRLAMQAARKLTTTTLLAMDSAPLDGTEVVLRVKSRAGVPGKYLVGHYMPGGHCIEDHPAISSGWYFWNGCMFDQAAAPEGWMPLPKDEPTTGEKA